MQINKYIDHTLLKQDATVDDIIKLCQEAIQYNFYSVCVNSCWVKVAKEELTESDVKVCSVVGFPLGAMEMKSKIFETEQACKLGADEIDMVINIGVLKTGWPFYVKDEISGVVDKAREHNAIVKVIIETALLTEEEIINACKLAVGAGAAFIKTSTGFSTRGASVEDIALIKKTIGPNTSVKASGGIRTYDQAILMIEAGADRLGTSNAMSIINR